MERFFWVECGQCHGRFCCDYGLRRSQVRLMCPYCKARFLPDEAPWLDERWRG